MAKENKKYPKHEKLDAWVEENIRLIYHTAHKIGLRHKIDPEELIGTLTLILNRCLHNYQPSKSKFSTYFVSSCWGSAAREFIEKERDPTRDYVYRQEREQHVNHRRVQHSETYILFVLECSAFDQMRSVKYNDDSLMGFDTSDEMWGAMKKRLLPQDYDLMCRLYGDGKNLTDVGKELGVTKEAVRQKRNKILKRLSKLFTQKMESGTISESIDLDER